MGRTCVQRGKVGSCTCTEERAEDFVVSEDKGRAGEIGEARREGRRASFPAAARASTTPSGSDSRGVVEEDSETSERASSSQSPERFTTVPTSLRASSSSLSAASGRIGPQDAQISTE